MPERYQFNYMTLSQAFKTLFAKKGSRLEKRTQADQDQTKIMIDRLEYLLTELQHQARTVDRYVITSTTDLHGTITSVSQAFCKISGYAREELIGKNHNIVRHPDMPKELYQDLWKTIKSGQMWKGEIKNLKKDGGYYWVEVHIEPLLDAIGDHAGYIAVRQDITDKKRVEALTITDELTQCYNRRFYNQILEKEVSRAKRDDHWLAFLMVDADNFKKYNDTYGHQEGDEVLKTIADVLKTTFKRASDYVFRLGGEEFAVLYRVREKAQGLMIAERARQEMFEQKIPHTGNPPYDFVTISAGLMMLDPSQTYIEEEIYKYADEALYQAKQNGRNTIVLRSGDDDIELF